MRRGPAALSSPCFGAGALYLGLGRTRAPNGSAGGRPRPLSPRAPARNRGAGRARRLPRQSRRHRRFRGSAAPSLSRDNLTQVRGFPRIDLAPVALGFRIFPPPAVVSVRFFRGSRRSGARLSTGCSKFPRYHQLFICLLLLGSP